MKIRILALCLLAAPGCRLLDTDGKKVEPSGTYAYVAYDFAGRPVVDGEWSVRAKDDAGAAYRLSGTWSMRPIAQDIQVGPQLGEGRLTGTVYDDSLVTINMNPTNQDNNVFLSGRFERTGYDQLIGQWQYVTLAGPRHQGTFRATRTCCE